MINELSDNDDMKREIRNLFIVSGGGPSVVVVLFVYYVFCVVSYLRIPPD